MAGEELVAKHQKMVRGLAFQLRRELSIRGDLEDLIAFGFGGLLEAERRFDPARGVRFQTFAYHRIRGAMLDGVRKMTDLSRRAYDRQRDAQGVATTAAPSPADKAFARIRAHLTGGSPLLSLRSDDTPEASLLQNEAIRGLFVALADLSPRERMLIRGHYFEGRSLDDLASELGCSRSWASRLHTRALARLRAALEPPEQTSADQPKSPCSR